MGYRNYGPANGYIVSKDSNGDFTTIQAAVTAAPANTTIFIKPGTFTENITLASGKSLAAWTTDAFTPNVTIIGTITLTTATTVSISGIRLQTNSAPFLSVTGSAASIVNLIDCYLNASNNNGITFSSSSSSAQINIDQCKGDIGSNTTFFAQSSPGTMNMRQCVFTNTGLSTTASTVTAGNFNCGKVEFNSNIIFSSTGASTMEYCGFTTNQLSSTNPSVTCGGNGNGFRWCRFNSGIGPCLSVSTNLCVLEFNQFNSSNTNCLTGTGTIQLGIVTFEGNSSNINSTLTVDNLISINGSTISFSAYLSTTQSNATGDGTIYTVIFDTALTNIGGGYNTSTGVFTAPVPGNYQFNYIIFYTNAATSTAFLNAFQGNNYNVRSDQLGAGAVFTGTLGSSGSMIFSMNAGDTMFMTAAAFGGTKTVGLNGAAPTSYATTCMFSGSLIG